MIGTIPACTGKPSTRNCSGNGPRDYPRMHGETWCSASLFHSDQGLSPHARGNHFFQHALHIHERTIPACTGKPTRNRRALSRTRDYPRMHGETNVRAVLPASNAGLSPHARGNPPMALYWKVVGGTIPACTGKPPEYERISGRKRDYPRMHGETRCFGRALRKVQGLSPHARGNRSFSPQHSGTSGTIPACTGKPRRSARSLPAARDYPRMHGETRRARQRHVGAPGLSPHARGNPGMPVTSAYCSGTIPACTGKPVSSTSIAFACKDYPRMHGETVIAIRCVRPKEGLSPHARGNPIARTANVQRTGTIPACTGKPEPGAR